MHCLSLCPQNKICDFTNEVDILSTFIGQAVSLSTDEELRNDLTEVASLTYKLMGMCRSNLPFTKEDILPFETTLKKYQNYSKEVKKSLFVLPLGSHLTTTLHTCRALSKKISRMYSKISKQFSNDEAEFFLENLSNLFYYLAIYVNHREGFKEVPFNSK